MPQRCLGGILGKCVYLGAAAGSGSVAPPWASNVMLRPWKLRSATDPLAAARSGVDVIKGRLAQSSQAQRLLPRSRMSSGRIQQRTVSDDDVKCKPDSFGTSFVKWSLTLPPA